MKQIFFDVIIPPPIRIPTPMGLIHNADRHWITLTPATQWNQWCPILF